MRYSPTNPPRRNFTIIIRHRSPQKGRATVPVLVPEREGKKGPNGTNGVAKWAAPCRLIVLKQSSIFIESVMRHHSCKLPSCVITRISTLLAKGRARPVRTLLPCCCHAAVVMVVWFYFSFSFMGRRYVCDVHQERAPRCAYPSGST